MKAQYNPSLDYFVMEPNIQEDPGDLTAFDGLELYEIGDGCCSHGCLVEKPKGQATNGPCTCFDKIPRHLRILCKRDFNEYCR